MPEENKPPAEGEVKKPFESIRGVHTTTLDEPVEAPAPESTKAEVESQVQDKKEEIETEEAKKRPDLEHIVRLKQELARLQRHVAQMGPYAQLGQAVVNEPKGQELAKRWQRGEKLFIDESEGYSMMDAQESQTQSGLTEESLRNILDQELTRREATKQAMDELTSLAKEHLEHFDKVSKNQLYAEFLSNNLSAVWNGHLPLEPETVDWADENKAKLLCHQTLLPAGACRQPEGYCSRQGSRQERVC